MTPEFQSLEEVILYRAATRVFNLREHSAGLDADFVKYLQPAKHRLFIKGSTFPVLDFTQPYYDAIAFRELNLGHTNLFAEEFSSNHGLTVINPEKRKRIEGLKTYRLPTPISKLDDIRKASGGLCDRHGEILLSGRTVMRYGHNFYIDHGETQQITLLTVTVICTLLHDLCKHARITASVTDFSSILKPEFYHYSDPSMGVYSLYKKTISALHDFVGHDLLNLYFVRYDDTNIYIEKSMDFRIYEYYRQRFETANER